MTTSTPTTARKSRPKTGDIILVENVRKGMTVNEIEPGKKGYRNGGKVVRVSRTAAYISERGRAISASTSLTYVYDEGTQFEFTLNHGYKDGTQFEIV